MRVVLQRVKSSSVEVNGQVIGEIGKGINVLLGISKEDTKDDVIYIRDKVLNLRIFEDENEKLNKSLIDVSGELIIISQFTLYGDCRRGRRPSFIEALSGDEAEKLYLMFVDECKKILNNKVQCGKFGADMNVKIENDGPVTILIDSKKTF